MPFCGYVVLVAEEYQLYYAGRCKLLRDKALKNAICVSVVQLTKIED